MHIDVVITRENMPLIIIKALNFLNSLKFPHHSMHNNYNIISKYQTISHDHIYNYPAQFHMVEIVCTLFCSYVGFKAAK